MAWKIAAVAFHGCIIHVLCKGNIDGEAQAADGFGMVEAGRKASAGLR
jgi:hypothetical protein